jgi:hypothetical protein
MTEQGDIHLVMYCVRGERAVRTLRWNYELIRSQVKKKKVPIILVVTCLESYKPEMEDWWTFNKRTISRMYYYGDNDINAHGTPHQIISRCL